MNDPPGSSERRETPMLFLIRHRYPRLGSVLSVLSGVAFIAYGVAEHSTFMIASSAAFLVLALVQAAHKRQHAPQARS
jgi:hypothetical protein